MVIVTVLIGWTILAVSFAGIVAMSAAHSTSGGWPAGATVALIIVGLVWALVPAIVWHRHGGRSGSSP